MPTWLDQSETVCQDHPEEVLNYGLLWTNVRWTMYGPFVICVKKEWRYF